MKPQNSFYYLFLKVGILVLPSFWMVHFAYGLLMNKQYEIGSFLLVLGVFFNYYMVNWCYKKIKRDVNVKKDVSVIDYFVKFYIGISLALTILGVVLVVLHLFFGIQIRYVDFDANNWLQFSLFLGAVVSVSVCEEMVFRGLVFGYLKNIDVNVWYVILVSSIISSVFHWLFFAHYFFSLSLWWFIIAFFVTTVLSYLYVYFKSIWTGLFFRLVMEVLLILIYDFEAIKIWSLDNVLNSYGLFTLFLVVVLLLLIVGIGIREYYFYYRKRIDLS